MAILCIKYLIYFLYHCVFSGAQYETSELRPWFPHPVTQEKTYIFWDACHMIKLCRNNLGDLRTFVDGDGNFIKWEHLERLVDLQVTEGLHAACKLTKRHINFQNERMNVRLAAQTLSASVSCALRFTQQNDSTSVDFNDCNGTATYCLLVNNCFDILNSRNVLSKN